MEQLAKPSTVSQVCVCREKQIIKTDQRRDVIIRNMLMAVQSLPRTATLQDGGKAAGTILNVSPPSNPKPWVYFSAGAGSGLTFLLAIFATKLPQLGGLSTYFKTISNATSLGSCS